MKKTLFVAAIAAMALTACSDDATTGKKAGDEG
jgi:outer membrane biogenesis lipoprotein LolB